MRIRLTLFGLSVLFLPAVTSAEAAAKSRDNEPAEKSAPAKREFRLSTTSPTASMPVQNSKATEVSTASSELPEGAMKVGVVDGKSKLPPELAAKAQEGATAVAAQDWEAAQKIYLEMVRVAPENALAYANLGVAEFQLGNLLAAAGNLRKSLSINPSISQNWQTLGLIHYQRGEINLAISDLTRAIHEGPGDARSRLYLAAVIRDNGWNEAAILELERAVQIDPDFADAHFNLAVSYLDQRPAKIELARRHYYTALDLGAPPAPEMESIFRREKGP